MSDDTPSPDTRTSARAETERWEDSPDYPHRIEDHVKVYLHLKEPQAGGGGGRWVVSGVTVDGYPLDGSEDGHYCDYEGHPVGARPDWDHQHQAAADVDLPTAEELLPLLADALGTSVNGPTVDQLRAASDILAEHAQWRSERAGLSAAESASDFPAASEWHDSDDTGCDLADRAIALLAELTGQPSPTLAPSPPATSTGVPLMRSALTAAPDTPPPARVGLTSTSQPPSGPGR